MNDILNSVKNVDSISTDDRSLAAFESLVSSGTSDNTRKSYQSSILSYIKLGLKLPANQNDIRKYLTLAAGSDTAPATVSVRLAALRKWHETKGYPDPTASVAIKTALKGYKKEFYNPSETALTTIKPSSRCGHAAALRVESLPKLLESIRSDDSAKSARDCALLLTAFFGVFRASELRKIKCNSIAKVGKCLEITVFTKTDTAKPKARVLVMNENEPLMCPVLAIEKWILLSGKTDEDYLFTKFRKGDSIEKGAPLATYSISKLLKKWLFDAGLEKSEPGNNFSSHSFRRGFATSAARAGVGLERIQRQGNWKSVSTVLLYIDEAKAISENPANDLYSIAKPDD